MIFIIINIIITKIVFINTKKYKSNFKKMKQN